MICRFCGAQLSETAIYCNKCGRQLRETPRKEPESLRAQTETSAFSYDKPPEPVRPVTPTGRGVDHSPYDEKQKPQPSKKSGKGWIVVCVALCLVIASGLAAWRVWNALKSGLDNGGDPTAKGTPAKEDEPKIDEPEDVPNKGEPKTEVPEKNEPSLPVQEDWSYYMLTLPDYVTEENYEIEEKLFYSSCAMEYQDSTTTDSMDGWELYDTTTEYGSYGSLSQWQEGKPKVNDSKTRKVEQKPQYKYTIKETTVSNKSSMSGWTFDHSETGSTQWSGKWSYTPITKTSTTDVKTKTVETTEYHLHHYCNKLSDGSLEVASKYFTDATHHQITFYSDSEPSTVEIKNYFSDRVRAYTISSESCSNSCSHWFADKPKPKTVTRTMYQSGTKSTSYYFYKWVEQDWSDEKRTESDKCKLVDTRTLYAYRDRPSTTTYHFRRWSDNWSEWSDQPIAESDELQVKTRTLYRYCSKP